MYNVLDTLCTPAFPETTAESVRTLFVSSAHDKEATNSNITYPGQFVILTWWRTTGITSKGDWLVTVVAGWCDSRITTVTTRATGHGMSRWKCRFDGGRGARAPSLVALGWAPHNLLITITYYSSLSLSCTPFAAVTWYVFCVQK